MPVSRCAVAVVVWFCLQHEKSDGLCRHAPVKKAFDFQGFDEKIYWDYGLRTSRKAFVKAQKLSELSGFNLAEEDGSETNYA